MENDVQQKCGTKRSMDRLKACRTLLQHQHFATFSHFINHTVEERVHTTTLTYYIKLYCIYISTRTDYAISSSRAYQNLRCSSVIIAFVSLPKSYHL